MSFRFSKPFKVTNYDIIQRTERKGRRTGVLLFTCMIFIPTRFLNRIDSSSWAEFSEDSLQNHVNGPDGNTHSCGCLCRWDAWLDVVSRSPGVLIKHLGLEICTMRADICNKKTLEDIYLHQYTYLIGDLSAQIFTSQTIIQKIQLIVFSIIKVKTVSGHH